MREKHNDSAYLGPVILSNLGLNTWHSYHLFMYDDVFVMNLRHCEDSLPRRLELKICCLYSTIQTFNYEVQVLSPKSTGIYRAPNVPAKGLTIPLAHLEEQLGAGADLVDFKVTEKRLNAREVVLLEFLECPICNEYMVAPIFTCSNGHNLCSSCKSSVQQCPFCRSTGLSVRNLALENISQRTTYPCKYMPLGCKMVFKAHGLGEHENACKFASYRICPMFYDQLCHCPKVDVASHLRAVHSPLFYKPKRIFLVHTRTRKPFETHGYFLNNNCDVTKFVIRIEGHVFKLFGMQLMESDGDLQYRCELCCINPKNNQYTVMLSLFCLPISTATDYPVSMPLQAFKTFIDAQGNMRVKVRFWKLNGDYQWHRSTSVSMMRTASCTNLLDI